MPTNYDNFSTQFSLLVTRAGLSTESSLKVLDALQFQCSGSRNAVCLRKAQCTLQPEMNPVKLHESAMAVIIGLKIDHESWLSPRCSGWSGAFYRHLGVVVVENAFEPGFAEDFLETWPDRLPSLSPAISWKWCSHHADADPPQSSKVSKLTYGSRMPWWFWPSQLRFRMRWARLTMAGTSTQLHNWPQDWIGASSLNMA